MALIGLGLAFWGWNERQNTQEFIAAAETAPGQVVDVIVKTDSDGDPMYYPEFTFTTAAGENVQVRSNVGSNPPAHRVGDKIEILYDPNQPLNAKVNSFSGVWLLPTILLGIGGLFILFGVLGLVNALLKLIGIGGILGIGAWLFMRNKKEQQQHNDGT